MLTTFSSEWKLKDFATFLKNVVNNNHLIVLNGWGSPCKYGRVENPRGNNQTKYRTPETHIFHKKSPTSE
jgi:hypothetical protein